MRIHRYGSRTGFLGVLVPSVSVKDRSLSAVLIGDGTVLTACREKEVVETGKPSTALLRKYRTSTHPLGRVEWPRRIGMHMFTFGGLS